MRAKVARLLRRFAVATGVPLKKLKREWNRTPRPKRPEIHYKLEKA